MDRTEFLEIFFSMFIQSFNEYNFPHWKRQYEYELTENIDYDSLEKNFMKLHKPKSGSPMTTPPSPIELKEIAKSLNLIRVVRPVKTDYKPSNSAPPPPEFYEHWAKLKEKLSMKGAL